MTRWGTLVPVGDVDWIAVELSEPGWYRVEVDYVVFEDAPATVIEVRDPSLRRLSSTLAGPEADDSTMFLARTPGRYLVRVANRDAAHASYKLAVLPADRYDQPPDDLFMLPRLHQLELRGTGGDVALAELTGDGRLDALVDGWDGAMLVPQADAGLFGPPQPLPGIPRPVREVTTADVDGDGRADGLFATDAGVDVLLQRPGSLAAPRTLPAPYSREVDAGDFDGDGDLDLFVMADQAWVFWQEAGDWRAEKVPLPVDRSWLNSEVEVGDVTGDGRADVVAAQRERGISVLAGRAVGGLAAPEPVDAALAWSCCDRVALGDVTDDGRADIVAAGESAFGPWLYVIPGLPGGGHGAAQIRPGGDAGALAIADVTGDGRGDVLAGGSVAYLYEQLTGGTLSGPRTYSAGGRVSHPDGLAVGDVTGDEELDVVAANSTFRRLTVLARRASWPAPAGPWVWDTPPAAWSAGVAPTVTPEVRFGRDVDPAGLAAELLDARSRADVPAVVSYDAAQRTLRLMPAAPLAPGPYLVRVRDRSSEELELRFTVGAAEADQRPPETRISSGPGPLATYTDRRLLVDADEPIARFECAFDGHGFVPCAPDDGLDLRSAGAATVRVRAVDRAGNVDPSPAARSWRVAESVWGGESPYNAIGLTGASGTTEHVVDATRWFRWTAPASGRVRFDTRGSEADLTLRVTTSAR